MSAGFALSSETLGNLDAGRITLPAYDRAGIKAGVLHFGPGAFHRAHQADYFDKLLKHDPRWGVTGVSLRSREVRDALAPQDGLYTLVTLDRQTRYSIVGSIKSVLCAHDLDGSQALVSPALKLITLTVTEKGYCLTTSGELDFTHPDIRSDIENPEAPKSVIGWIAKCLRQRRDADMVFPDILSCDNLSDNGDKLRRAVTDFLLETDAALAGRVEAEVFFPNSMVDAITPATNDALRRRVLDDTGVCDAWPVQREAFSSWVIEDSVSKHFPDLGAVGAVITSDVAGHEMAKLRMLNGAHSTLAYFGLAQGYRTVADAMADPRLAAFIDTMMREEIAPSISPPSGLDLDEYRQSLIQRFANLEIEHKLTQIGWDGSQKLPIRLVGTIIDNLRDGRPVAKLMIGVASWMRFICRQARSRSSIIDPESERLAAIGAACSDDPAHDCDLFLQRTRIFPQALREIPAFTQSLRAAYRQVMESERETEMAGT